MVSIMSVHKKWDGVNRRAVDKGRREEDHCIDHCYMVRLLDDHLKDAKDNAKNIAPMWAMRVLIGLVVVSTAYTFLTSANLSEKFTDRITQGNKDISEKISNNNQIIQDALHAIQTETASIKVDLAVAKSRQSDIKTLLESHMVKTEKPQTHGGSNK